MSVVNFPLPHRFEFSSSTTGTNADMSKRLRKFVRRLFAKLEEQPATPFVSPTNVQTDNASPKPGSSVSSALFQNVIDLVGSSGFAHRRASTSTASTYAPIIPVTSEKYPWHDDCFYVMIMETVKTTGALGVSINRSVRDYRILSPTFDCPYGTTDPLHWSHGLDDSLCLRTNEASVWCCSREHMYHIVDNCRKNISSPPRCPHGCVFAKVINKEDAFLQDRATPTTRASVHTPVPWIAASNLSVTANPASAMNHPVPDRNVVFPIPEPAVDGHYVALPVAGSHLLYELDMKPSNAYPACVAELRPISTTTAASHGTLLTPPGSYTGTPVLIHSSDNLPRIFKTVDIPSIALNGQHMTLDQKDRHVTPASGGK